MSVCLSEFQYLYSCLECLQLSPKLAPNFKPTKITDAKISKSVRNFSNFASNLEIRIQILSHYKNPLKSAMTFFLPPFGGEGDGGGGVV